MVPESAPSPLINTVIGERYRVIKRIGEGGMGEVFLAEHIHIEKKVALKLLRAEVLSNHEAVVRFRQEARSASSIGHDNIINIDDFGTLSDGRVYMAMEFLQGSPLNDMLAAGPLPLNRALDILIQTAKGLSAAHAKGITHRDMKPENIFVVNKEGRDVPKILDFGIAKVSGGDTSRALTVAGTIFGTPFYMAPEQAMGGQMDQRVDIYAMGVILFEVFCGQVPFKSDTFMGILTQHITAAPPPPEQIAAQNGRQIPPEVVAIIQKAMQKNPGDRYQKMPDLAAALVDVYRQYVGARSSAEMSIPEYSGRATSGIQIVQPKKSKTGLFVGLGALVLVGGGIGIFVATQGGSKPPPVDPKLANNGSNKVVTPPPVAPPPDAAPVVKVKAVDAGPKEIEILVGAEPPATIYKGDEKIGDTPWPMKIHEGDKVALVLKAKGYKDMPITLDGSESRIVKKLERIVIAGVPAGPKGDPAAKPPQTPGTKPPPTKPAGGSGDDELKGFP